jgi:hypothetical protein
MLPILIDNHLRANKALCYKSLQDFLNEVNLLIFKMMFSLLSCSRKNYG